MFKHFVMPSIPKSEPPCLVCIDKAELRRTLKFLECSRRSFESIAALFESLSEYQGSNRDRALAKIGAQIASNWATMADCEEDRFYFKIADAKPVSDLQPDQST